MEYISSSTFETLSMGAEPTLKVDSRLLKRRWKSKCNF